MEADEAGLRMAIRDWQASHRAAGGIPYLDVAKLHGGEIAPLNDLAARHGVETSRCYDIYKEEGVVFRASPEGKAVLDKSARSGIYLGIVLWFIIPPLGVYLLWCGMADEAESRGYSRSLGALSILGLLGLLIVTCLPDRAKSNSSVWRRVYSIPFRYTLFMR